MAGESPFKFASLRLEVNKEQLAVWFRLYAADALNLRGFLDPGAVVLIRGRVRCYQRSGGYRPSGHLEDPESDPVHVRVEDMFTLDVGDLQVVLAGEDYRGFPPLDALRETLWKALDRLRVGLDSTGSGIEDYHEAEELLSGLLGNPIWNRPK